ncbi:pyridoxal phosphate-dependent transferase [Naviculisporaceae sp. PSN 640]
MSPKKDRTSSLDGDLSGILARRRSKNQLRQLTKVPPGTADFSSNNYLSLPSHPDVQRAFLAKLQKAQESNLLGSGGSRLLDGNSLTAENLEQTIAKFHNAPAGLLFNSAMDANIGLFSCIPQARDVIVYDELIHASVHDGMRLSRAERKIPFAHNMVYGEGGKNPSLERVLLALAAEDRQERQDESKSGKKNVFIAVEGVYSMDGDVTPLVDIVECTERLFPRHDAHIIVDEAHSVGVLGDCGRGLVSRLGLEDRVWARVLGFGKAIGCSGGIVLCSPTTRLYLINYARTLIYTTMMAYSSLISIETAYGFLCSGKAIPLLNHLQALIRHTHKLLQDLSDRLPRKTGLFRLHRIKPTRSSLHDKEDTQVLTPVIPVLTSHPRSLASHCQQRKFMVRPIVAPTVPKGQERIRICLHAANTFSEVEALVHAMEEWVLGQLARENGAEWRETQEVSLVEPTPGSSAKPQELNGVINKAKL